MRKLGLILAFLMLCSVAKAQCVAEFKDTEMDLKGSVKVIAQYVINGQAVDVSGEPCDNCTCTSGRYDESYGTLQEIIELNKADRRAHCKSLIIGKLSKKKLEEIAVEKVTETKKQNDFLMKELKKEIGSKETIISVKEVYKTKEFTVEADGTYTVSDIVE